ncbi:MAG: PD-(D/E)XK nuclease family protein [Rhodothermales bacterium]
MNDLDGPRLVDEIDQALREGGRLSALKILIAPTGAEGRALRVGLARHGVSLVNVEAVTPRSLARLVLRPTGLLDGWLEWDHTTGVRMTSWYMEQLDWPDDHALRHAHAPLYRLLQALRMEGIRPDGWVEAGGDPRIGELMRVWDEGLMRAGAVDGARVAWMALENVDAFLAARKPTLLIRLADMALSREEARLVDALSGSVRTVTVGGGTGVAAGRAITGVDRHDEVRRVWLDVVEAGIPFDDVQIAMAQADVYEPELVAAAMEAGIPVTLQQGRPVTGRPEGRLVQAVLDWMADGFPSDGLSACIRLGMMPVDAVRKGEILDVLAAWPVRTGSIHDEAWVARWIRAVERERLSAAAAQDVVDLLRRVVPVSNAPLVWPADVWDTLVDVVGVQAAARGAILPGLDAGVRLPWSRCASWLADWWRSVREQEETDAGGGVLLVPLHRSMFTLRAATWVVGLDHEAVVPESGSVLEGLPMDVQRTARKLVRDLDSVPKTASLQDMVGQLARHSKLEALSFAAFDIVNARSQFPHRAFRAWTRRGKLQDNPANGDGGAGKAARLWDMTDIIRAVPRDHAVQWAGEAHPELAPLLAAQAARSGPEWTPHDGMVGTHPALAVWPRRTSASALEDLSECPFRYFIQNILRVRPVRERTEFLDAAERGLMAHRLFEWAVKWQRETPDRAALAERLEAALLDALRTHAEVAPKPGPHAWKESVRDLQLMVDTLLAVDEHALSEVVETEWTFDGAAMGRWAVAGRIDRIDRNDEGMETILDYKTGGAGKYTVSKLQDLQRYLQWAVYAVVRQQAQEPGAQANVARSGYRFMRPGEWGTEILVQAPDPGTVGDVLDRLASRVEDGWFIQIADPNECRYCPVRKACGDLELRKQDMDSKEQAGIIPADTFTEHLNGWMFASKLGGASE